MICVIIFKTKVRFSKKKDGRSFRLFKIDRTRKMQPKLNKLITLLLLLGTFAFLSEAEERVRVVAEAELSKWASLLPKNEKKQVQTINPYAQQVSISQVILSKIQKEDIPTLN